VLVPLLDLLLLGRGEEDLFGESAELFIVNFCVEFDVLLFIVLPLDMVSVPVS